MSEQRTGGGKLALPCTSVTLDQFVRVCRTSCDLIIEHAALSGLDNDRFLLEKATTVDGQIMYGLNTGLGSLARVRLPASELLELSRRVVLSHACGVGEPLSEDVVRGAMFLLANSLLKGYSGISSNLPITLVRMLNAQVHPYVPSQGSLGASGDLAPLAHIAIVLSKDSNDGHEDASGKAYFGGQLLSGAKAMQVAGIDRVVLGPKEGLAAVNGTHVTTSLLALASWDAKTLLSAADVIASMSLDALQGLSVTYDPRVHQLRPHRGQMESSSNLSLLLSGSQLVDSVTEAIQDPYTLRCIPQVHGACRDAVRYVEEVTRTELNSITDNPLVFLDSTDRVEVLSSGNFHAEPLGYAADTLGIALTGLGTFSERRACRLVDRSTNGGLPSFLIENPGLNSGFMIAHYTSAALASENKVLSHPASVDSIPVSENSEDHVSMATIAARKAGKILENTAKICSIEMLVAAQALDLRCRQIGQRRCLGSGTSAALSAVRRIVPFLERDRELSQYIELGARFILSGELIRHVEQHLGASLC